MIKMVNELLNGLGNKGLGDIAKEIKNNYLLEKLKFLQKNNITEFYIMKDVEQKNDKWIFFYSSSISISTEFLDELFEIFSYYKFKISMDINDNKNFEIGLMLENGDKK